MAPSWGANECSPGSDWIRSARSQCPSVHRESRSAPWNFIFGTLQRAALFFCLWVSRLWSSNSRPISPISKEGKNCQKLRVGSIHILYHIITSECRMLSGITVSNKGLFVLPRKGYRGPKTGLTQAGQKAKIHALGHGPSLFTKRFCSKSSPVASCKARHFTPVTWFSNVIYSNIRSCNHRNWLEFTSYTVSYWNLSNIMMHLLR